ncbi:hypothetical protein BKA82DRAFT_4173461 [Pisolithus tinctorius]|nr:hypothetical protein BKA82DRAFT_4211460 [Pisolithus tinctorius]KAI6144610.1 hypothetical protein BKA82DRAFT_4173461 [Pisolithus tinctorius]
MNPAAWDIIHEFAASDSISLPDVECRLKTLLGSTYIDQDWWPAINAIFAAENDTNLAIQEVERLATIATNTSRLTIHIQHPGGSSGKQPAPQIIAVKKDLLKAVEELHRLKGIKDDVPPVNELCMGMLKLWHISSN